MDILKSTCISYPTKILCHVESDVKYMSMNESRKIAGVIRELLEVSGEAIGAKLPLLFQTLSQLVGAC